MENPPIFPDAPCQPLLLDLPLGDDALRVGSFFSLAWTDLAVGPPDVMSWFESLLQARRVASAGTNPLRSVRRVVAPRLAHWSVPVDLRRRRLFVPVWVPPLWC